MKQIKLKAVLTSQPLRSSGNHVVTENQNFKYNHFENLDNFLTNVIVRN